MHLNQWYSPTIVILALLGFFASSLYKGRNVVIIGFLGSILLIIYFQQISNIHRIMTLERTLLSIMASLCIALGVAFLMRSVKYFRNNRILRNKVTKLPSIQSIKNLFTSHIRIKFTTSTNIIKRKILDFAFTEGLLDLGSKTNYSLTAIIPIFILILILLVPSLKAPYEIYIGQFTSLGSPFANFSFESIKAGEWIEKNSPKDFAVYSDPTTVLEMRGLGFRKNIEGISWDKTVQGFVKDTMSSDDPISSHQKIVSKFGKDILIVLTPRTAKWLKDPNSVSIQIPSGNFEPFDGFKKFSNGTYFTPLYHSKSIFIYAPK